MYTYTYTYIYIHRVYTHLSGGWDLGNARGSGPDDDETHRKEANEDLVRAPQPFALVLGLKLRALFRSPRNEGHSISLFWEALM